MTLRVQKLGNGPQEGPDREEAWGVAWNANFGTMGNLSLQKGELPKILCIVFYSWEDRYPKGQENLQQFKSAKQSIVIEIYWVIKQKRANSFCFWTGFLLLS